MAKYAVMFFIGMAAAFGLTRTPLPQNILFWIFWAFIAGAGIGWLLWRT